MTTNAFIFVWDQHGIESIIPITQYENHDHENCMRVLRDEPMIKNPLDTIIRNILLRARINGHRQYEIYSVDCADTMDTQFWNTQWDEHPQETAELLRERGHKLFSSRTERDIKIA